MKKVVCILGLVALGAGAAWGWFHFYNQEESGWKLYGNVEIRGVDWGFRVGGKVAELLKDEGDAVKAGECLARLDPAPYAHDLAMRTAEAAAAEQELALKQHGYRKEEIEQFRAQLGQAKVAFANAILSWKRQNGLISGGGTSRQNLENAEAARDEAEQQVKVAEARLRLLEAGFRSEEIAAAREKLALTQAARDAATLRMTDTNLVAAADGTVLTRAAEAGSIVQPGAAIFGISLEKPVWVRAYANETLLPHLAPGTEVLLHVDGVTRTYHGKIGFVSPKAEFTPKSVETPELRTMLVYRLRIVVTDPDAQLRQGMPVEVTTK